MTRRLLVPAALTLALLFSGLVADSPAPAAGAAMVPPAAPGLAPIAAPTFDAQLGDGVLRVRIRGCHDCRTEVSIRIELPRFAVDLVTR
jgi:hypothetical protein